MRLKISRQYIKRIHILLAFTYLAVIVYITLLCRNVSIYQQRVPYPFWSYIHFLQGNWSLGLQIIENILLFIPLGYIMKAIGFNIKWIVLIGLIVSTCVEGCQFVFCLGLFEVDDILHNVLGCFCGTILFIKFKVSDYLTLVIGVVIVVCSIAFCFTYQKSETSYQKEFFFEVENLVCRDEELTISGYCFRYEEPHEEYQIILKSNDSATNIDVAIHLPSNTINNYYKCENNYSQVGFKVITKIDTNEMYEILVKWSNGITMSTGTYIRNNQVIYSSNPAPAFDGTLLVACPEYDFYVYQKGGELYWLCGDRFPFEDDGSTYIQYQLWTTQIDNLPEKRLANEWFWDNIGFVFEDNEIESWNGYRVAKRAIPEEYSITSIVTGYYKDGKWIWKDYFRPIVFDLPWY